VIVLVRHIPVSPWPTCVDDVSSAESDDDLLVVVSGESVVTVVSATVQTIKIYINNEDAPLLVLFI